MSASRSSNHVKVTRNGRSRPGRGAAFYDLDGTLVDLNLVHAALFVQSNLGEWSARVGYLLAFLARAPRLYLAERDDRRVLNAVLFESLKGVSADRLSQLGAEYCERVLIKHLYPQGVEMLRANRDAGLEPVIVSGSPDFIVAPLADHLGVSEFAANRLTMLGGRATGRLAEPIMAGEEKAAWCARFAVGRKLDLGASWGYADSYYDVPFLAALGHPVAVNPDRKLRRTAASRHWPVVEFDHSRSVDAKRDEPSAAAFGHHSEGAPTRRSNGGAAHGAS
jgi:alcohol-forming fatty acyl-CoA reductase